jgi:hypothetical protein
MNRSARVVGALAIAIALAAAVMVFNMRRLPDRERARLMIGPATVQQDVAHDMSGPLASLTNGEQDGGGSHSEPFEPHSSKFEVRQAPSPRILMRPILMRPIRMRNSRAAARPSRHRR